MKPINIKLFHLSIILAVAYLLTYALLRYTGELVRFELPARNQYHIIAPEGEWSSLMNQMAMKQSSSLLRILHAIRRSETPALNKLFWPLRTTEAACWNVLERW